MGGAGVVKPAPEPTARARLEIGRASVEGASQLAPWTALAPPYAFRSSVADHTNHRD